MKSPINERIHNNSLAIKVASSNNPNILSGIGQTAAGLPGQTPAGALNGHDRSFTTRMIDGNNNHYEKKLDFDKRYGSAISNPNGKKSPQKFFLQEHRLSVANNDLMQYKKKRLKSSRSKF